MKATGAARWWALGALALCLLAVGLDMTVLNVALPNLAVDLRASTGQLQWIAASYTLVMAAALLPAGMLGDRLGRKKMLLSALVLFGIASLGCAYAQSTGELIAARAALGLAAAFLTPLSMSVLTVLFEPAERPRAIAVWTTANALGVPLGPIVGGWLLDHFWWGSVFLINVPTALVGLIAVALLVPESRSRLARAFDPVGVLLSSVGLLCVTFGLIRAGSQGWGDPTTLAMLVIGVVMLAGFAGWQRRVRDPLVDLTLFRSRSFTWGTVLSAIAIFAMAGLLFTLPQFFHAVNGADSLVTGLRLLPIIGGLLVGAQLADRIGRRIGAKVIVAAGFVAMATGLVFGAATDTASGYGYVATWLAVMGFGLGLAMPTAMGAAVSEFDAERSGVGSALLMSLRQVGSSVGVAVLGTVLSTGYRDRLDLTGLNPPAADAVSSGVNTGVGVADATHSARLLASVRAAFTHGMGNTLWLCAGLAVVAIGLTVAFLPARSATIDNNDGPGGHAQPARAQHSAPA